MLVQSSAQAASSQSNSSSTNQSLGKDEFLTLLVASLQHQDPLSPMENTDFVAQMAQFSTVEQLFGVNDNLESIMLVNSSINNTQALNLIGKEVEATGDGVHISGGTSTDISFELGENADDVTIQIIDSNGNLVRTIEMGYMAAGDHQIEWDGQSNNGISLDDGLYNYYVDATDTNGETVDTTTHMRGIVESISMEGGVTYAHIGDNRIMLSDISLVSINRNSGNTQ